MNVSIVSFNDNEAEAVDQLTRNDLSSAGWSYEDDVWRSPTSDLTVRHVALRAQGNVVAGAELARSRATNADYIVFYGCAGGVRDAAVGDVFAVSSAVYMSLGSVKAGVNAESVRLKNRYFAQTPGGGRSMLQAFAIPSDTGLFGLVNRSAILNTCYAISTDKVVKVAPSDQTPPQLSLSPYGALFSDEEWTYADATAYLASLDATVPSILDMESYGILAIANAIKSLSEVLILRVVTDTLIDHQGSADLQRHLLVRGRLVIMQVLTLLQGQGGGARVP